jgi:hypothetical protein
MPSLRAGLNEHLRRLTDAFNTEIRESCRMLLPDAKELREMGIGEAHRPLYLQWTSSRDTSLFARTGIAAAEQEAQTVRHRERRQGFAHGVAAELGTVRR